MMTKWERIALISGLVLVVCSIVYGAIRIPHELRGGVYVRLGEIQATIRRTERTLDRYNALFEKRIDILNDIEKYRAIGGLDD